MFASPIATSNSSTALVAVFLAVAIAFSLLPSPQETAGLRG